MKRKFMVTASLAVLCTAAPAMAGEEIVYDRQPAWIDAVAMSVVRQESPTNTRVFDNQLRIENGRLWDYLDSALAITNPQELTQLGTLTATWLPDKGDLIVHEVSIVRGDEVIDLIAAGNRLDILRREESLEQRILDGQLTATMAVPGLRIGDILRVRYSTTLSDQALANEVESLNYLFRAPDFRAGFARVLASWEDTAPVRYLAGPAVKLPEPELRDGYRWLEIELPLAKAEDLPFDAPMRYHRPAMLQIGTFADWSEVSSVMAPFYQVKESISAGSELHDKVSAIARAHKDELARAVAALELVQEEIGYLANGMEGGNYIPQLPQMTWDMRYGDCKAKTVLLLALLDGLGIEAEAALVSSSGGDALPEMLPMAGVFDHVLVRARIDGHDYWLDGTGAGANIKIVGNVPPFGYALPIRAAGAGLEPIDQVLPRVVEADFAIEIDQTAGVDIPALFHADLELTGPMAAMLNAAKGSFTDEQRFGFAGGMIGPVMGMAQILSVEFQQLADDSELRLSVDGLVTSPIRHVDGRGEQQFRLPASSFEFAPDRSRRQWRDIPVALGPQTAGRVTYKVKLPGKGEGFTLSGARQIDETVAGRRFFREVDLEGGLLTIEERVSLAGGELAAADIAEERRRAATLTRNNLVLKSPEKATRRWVYAGGADRSVLAPIERAYQAQIDREPDEMEHYLNRARFREGTFDFAGALEDYTAAIELENSPDLLAARAQIHANMLQDRQALADLQEAYDFDPSPSRAIALAGALADNGDIAAARELLEQQDGDRSVRQSIELALADLDARSGAGEQGLERIDRLLRERPNDAELLNAKCWHVAAWQVALNEAEELCTKAVENAGYVPPVLDSRAMHYLRAGDYRKALADAEAALQLAPEQAQTLLLRGLIRQALGEEQASGDIREALARTPASRDIYRRYGFDLN